MKNELLNDILNTTGSNNHQILISRCKKIKNYIKQLCTLYRCKLLDFSGGSASFSAYIKFELYQDVYLYLQFDLTNIEKCLDNIKCYISNNFNLIRSTGTDVPFEDLEQVIYNYAKTKTIKGV